MLNPVVMSRTVKINPLLVLLAILVGTSIGDWIGRTFGSFVAALLSIPAAGALQVVGRELWRLTGTPGPPGGERAPGPEPPAGDRQAPSTPHDSGRQAGEDSAAPVPAAVADATAVRLG